MVRVNSVQSEDVQFGLIWIWQTFLGRRLVGHGGVLPGVSTHMWANENRTLGVIVLSNGDTTAPDEQSVRVKNALVRLILDLFECFE